MFVVYNSHPTSEASLYVLSQTKSCLGLQFFSGRMHLKDKVEESFVLLVLLVVASVGSIHSDPIRVFIHMASRNNQLSMPPAEVSLGNRSMPWLAVGKASSKPKPKLPIARPRPSVFIPAATIPTTIQVHKAVPCLLQHYRVLLAKLRDT